MGLRVQSRLSETETKRLLHIVEEPQSSPEAAAFRATGRKEIWRVSLGGSPLFLKIYRARPFPGSLKDWLRATPGMQLWKIAARVEAAGIETPGRAAAGEKWAGLRPVYSFFACEDVRDAAPLAALVAEAAGWEASRRERFAAALGERFGRLAATGFVQPDLKPTNFLVRGDPAGEFRLLPIDLRQVAMGGIVGKWRDRKTGRQLRERVLAGWPEAAVAAFFGAYSRER
jgi:hypothetical protein